MKRWSKAAFLHGFGAFLKLARSIALAANRQKPLDGEWKALCLPGGVHKVLTICGNTGPATRWFTTARRHNGTTEEKTYGHFFVNNVEPGLSKITFLQPNDDERFLSKEKNVVPSCRRAVVIQGCLQP
ncbi:hypothetical protein EPD60_07660, partial [Flaviaesturariibacter flavus]